jgi:hypothetical protein
MKLLPPIVIGSCMLLAAPATLLAADITLDSTTMVRFSQIDATGSGKEDVQPASQFLGLDATKLADGNLSLHLHGWGRVDLGDNSYGESTTAGDLSYGYLRYRFGRGDADLRAGRFFVREGIVNEQVDGVSARTNLPFGFSLSAFGGATVHTKDLYGESSDGKGDYLAGGRVGFRFRQILDLGVSGVYEDKAPLLLHHVNGTNRRIGGDIWLNPHRAVDIVGHTSYNTETKKIAEHRYLLTIRPGSDLTVSGEFADQRDQSLLYSWALFSAPLTNPDDKSRIYGGTIAYGPGKPAIISLNYRHYDRENGSADRYGGDLKLLFLDNSLRSGLTYSYLEADRNFAIAGTTSASYHTIRGYIQHDTKSYFAALDLLCQLFDEKIHRERSAYEGAFSLGYHLTPTLTISGDISYGKNPDYENETKGLVRLTYNTTFVSGGGNK